MTRSAPARTDTVPRSPATRVLVGGVGYRNLSDLSAGPLVVDGLGDLGEDVEVEDLSYGPIDVLFKLQGRVPYDALVVVAAASRGDPPGTIRHGRWAPQPLDLDALQGRIAEAVTGVISHENLLHILGHFGALPERTVVIEIEPAVPTFGEHVSPAVSYAMERAAALVRTEVALA